MQSTPLPPAVLFARSADCTLWRPLLESLHVAPLCWGRRAGLLLTLPDMWLSWGTKQHRFNSFYSTALLKWTCKLLSHYFSTFTLTLKKKKEKKRLYLRFTEAFSSEPVGYFLWRRVKVQRNGSLWWALDEQRFVQIGLSIGQPVEQLVIYQHGCKE